MELIRIRSDDKKYLDEIKDHPRDTYGDMVHKLVECWKEWRSPTPKLDEALNDPNRSLDVTPKEESLLGNASIPEKVNDRLINN